MDPNNQGQHQCGQSPDNAHEHHDNEENQGINGKFSSKT